MIKKIYLTLILMCAFALSMPAQVVVETEDAGEDIELTEEEAEEDIEEAEGEDEDAEDEDAFRPRLRSRLTLGGRTFPKKP